MSSLKNRELEYESIGRENKDRLENAIQGRRAFCRFKDMVMI